MIMEAILYRITLWSFFSGMLAHFLAFFPKEGSRAGGRLDSFANLLIVAGFISLSVNIATRWVVQARVPISSSYEYLSVLAWFVAVLYFIVVLKMRGSILGACISPALFLSVVFAGLYPQRLEMTLIPALQSYWLKIHVTMTIIGEAAFAVAFVAGILYLVRNCRWEEVDKGVKRKSLLLAPAALAVGIAVALVFWAGGLALTGVSGPRLLVCILGLGFLVAAPVYLFAWRKLLSQGPGNLGGFLFALTVLSLIAGGMVLGSMVNRNRGRMDDLLSKIRSLDRLVAERVSGETGFTEETWKEAARDRRGRLEVIVSLETLQEENKRALTSADAAGLLAGSPLEGELEFPLSLGEIRGERFRLEQELSDLDEIKSELGTPAKAEALASYRKMLVSRYNGFFSTALLPHGQGREAAFIGYMALAAAPLFALFLPMVLKIRRRIPDLETLDSVAYRTVSLGFPVFTFGALLAGAVWAH
ncbi:MAG: cytochrome c biogenesis protein CcsA, partial [Gemmatimonadota bacterium]|nr:cytochrome c biogenesis protein CcsA [Gemmatimonadota bacterium]